MDINIDERKLCGTLMSFVMRPKTQIHHWQTHCKKCLYIYLPAYSSVSESIYLSFFYPFMQIYKHSYAVMWHTSQHIQYKASNQLSVTLISKSQTRPSTRSLELETLLISPVVSHVASVFQEGGHWSHWHDLHPTPHQLSPSSYFLSLPLSLSSLLLSPLSLSAL